jgi:hypothetical protein
LVFELALPPPSPLMVEEVPVSEMLDTNSILIWLFTQEDFIAFSHHESFNSLIMWTTSIRDCTFSYSSAEFFSKVFKMVAFYCRCLMGRHVIFFSSKKKVLCSLFFHTVQHTICYCFFVSSKKFWKVWNQ